MKTYRVISGVQGSKYQGEVEAENLEEAVKKAEKILTSVSLCHQCVDQCEDGEVDSWVVEAEDGSESHSEPGFYEGMYLKSKAEAEELKQILHAIALNFDVGGINGLARSQLLLRVSEWSQAHRAGNGELTENEVWDLVHTTKKKLVAAVRGKTEEAK